MSNYLIELSDQTVAKVVYAQRPQVNETKFFKIIEDPELKGWQERPFFTTTQVQKIIFLRSSYNSSYNSGAFSLEPRELEALTAGMAEFNSFIKPWTGQQVHDYYAG